MAAELDDPASNEVRVRVEGAWKMSAIVRRWSASDDSGAALSSTAAIEQPVSSDGDSSAPVRK